MPQKLLIRQAGDFRQYEAKDTAAGAVAGDVVALNAQKTIDVSLLPLAAALGAVDLVSDQDNIAGKKTWKAQHQWDLSATGQIIQGQAGGDSTSLTLKYGDISGAGGRRSDIRARAGDIIIGTGSANDGSAPTRWLSVSHDFVRPSIANVMQLGASTNQWLNVHTNELTVYGDAASKARSRTSLGAVGTTGNEGITGTKTFADDTNIRATKYLQWVNAAGDTVHGSMTTTGANQVVIGAGPSGTIYFRPQGSGVLAGQCTITSNGTMTFGNALATRQGLGAVGLTTDETINGVKTFSATPVLTKGSKLRADELVEWVADNGVTRHGAIRASWSNALLLGAGNSTGAFDGAVYIRPRGVGESENQTQFISDGAVLFGGAPAAKERTLNSIGGLVNCPIPETSANPLWVKIGVLPWVGGGGTSTFQIEFTDGANGARKFNRNIVNASTRGSFSSTTLTLTQVQVDQILEHMFTGSGTPGDVASTMRVGLVVEGDGTTSTGVAVWLSIPPWTRGHTMSRWASYGTTFLGRNMLEVGMQSTTAPEGIQYCQTRRINGGANDEVVRFGTGGAGVRGDTNGSLVLSSAGPSTGGLVFVRPNGNGNTSGQTIYNTDGSVVMDGSLRPATNNLRSIGQEDMRHAWIYASNFWCGGTMRVSSGTPGVWYNEADGQFSMYQVLDGNIMQWQLRNQGFENSVIHDMPLRFHLTNKNVEMGYNFVPRTDNSVQIGSPTFRFKEVCAINGTINTSDGRLKTDPRKFTDDEVEAFMEISRLPGIWQWLERVQEVGEDVARLHCGPVVQQAISIMDRYLLDWTRYSMFCYDQWDAVPEVLGKLPDEFDAEGILVKEGEPYVLSEAIEAGDRYSFRATELLYAISFAQTSTLDKQAVNLADLQSRVSVIEKKLSSL